ncbi:hypothetical protein OUZ56_032897 [Daphnia magna]|uniref:Uncharacterized protein n=1 Tax=Daphnia magna TaxID=35525 RepID=A0ABR0B9V1_9CRUS|nr:hypothetical protein OUZ56_032897 [Daphnia magna]
MVLNLSTGITIPFAVSPIIYLVVDCLKTVSTRTESCPTAPYPSTSILSVQILLVETVNLSNSAIILIITTMNGGKGLTKFHFVAQLPIAFVYPTPLDEIAFVRRSTFQYTGHSGIARMGLGYVTASRILCVLPCGSGLTTGSLGPSNA